MKKIYCVYMRFNIFFATKQVSGQECFLVSKIHILWVLKIIISRTTCVDLMDKYTFSIITISLLEASFTIYADNICKQFGLFEQNAGPDLDLN